MVQPVGQPFIASRISAMGAGMSSFMNTTNGTITHAIQRGA
ncbi:hypothetical protein [Geothrix mesophila]|nr:hypothetical protein [Geothrix sp. SG198]